VSHQTLGATLRQEAGQGESRVPIVLPSDPICYHKVRRRWNQEQRKVLIMRVEQEGVEGLGESFNIPKL
jgi:hypothetical protein